MDKIIVQHLFVLLACLRRAIKTYLLTCLYLLVALRRNLGNRLGFTI